MTPFEKQGTNEQELQQKWMEINFTFIEACISGENACFKYVIFRYNLIF